jgi:phospholipid/cholesterol/gamma-HCH transport system permease protein
MTEKKKRLANVSLPPPSGPRHSLAPRLPGVTVQTTEGTRGSVGMLAAIVRAFRGIEAPEVWRQINEIGLRSLGFICLVLGFVGAILVHQAGIQALRIVPDTSTVGPSYLELLVKDLAATITGLMLATRVGAGIAAEIGSMKVTDQLDALRLCRTDPIEYLVAPRVLASLVVTPFLTIFGGSVAVLTGAITGYWSFGINPTIFLDGRYVTTGTLLIGMTKSIAFGLAIPLVSAHSGLYTTGGSEGVGNATTRAVVGSSLAVIVLGFFIGLGGQLVLG